MLAAARRCRCGRAGAPLDSVVMFGSGAVLLRWFGGVLAVLVAVLAVGMPSALATWSVVGVDAETGEVGVAVASCVGFEVSVVPVLVPGIGVAASQADISESSGERLVDSLEGGATAAQAVEEVVAADEAPGDRQFGVVVLGGGGAGWTGSEAFDVALDERGAGEVVSVQGNILVSEDVVAAAITAFEASSGDLADRLVDALVAGADEGGDSRCGEQTATSAALIVAKPGDAPYAHTDAGVFGVDPGREDVPSVFVSVLVEEGGDRAPDRLEAAWAEADRSSDQVVIQQIDPGADTSADNARRLVGVVVLIALGLVVVAIGLLLMRRRRSAAG